MAREERLNIPGGTYHVMNRGNRKALIFEDERDCRRFLRLLTQMTARYHVEILAQALMGNHFHLIVLTPHGNLSEFMQQLEGQFAQYSNWRHSRNGHLFQGRFEPVVIENDIHLFSTLYYVFTNPVAARLVAKPEDWEWSTYAASAGLAPTPQYLSNKWIETLFPAEALSDSQRLLRECMNDPQPILAYLRAVDPTTEAAVRSFIVDRLRDLPQPCSYRTLMRPPLEHLFRRDLSRAELRCAIVTAHETHGYRIAEIARCVGLHPASVSRIYCSMHPKTG